MSQLSCFIIDILKKKNGVNLLKKNINNTNSFVNSATKNGKKETG